MSATYSIYTSPTHQPIPDHLPTLIVCPYGKTTILYTYLHTNFNKEQYLLTPSDQGDLCVAKLYPPNPGAKSSSSGHGHSDRHAVRCEASRNLRWTIRNEGIQNPVYKLTLPNPDGSQVEQPLFQVSKPNPHSPWWTLFYFTYAGHLIPPKRIEFGKIMKSQPTDGGKGSAGTKIMVTGKTDEEKAVWKTLGEGNEDMVEWIIVCAALNVLDDEITKAAEAAGVHSYSRPPPSASTAAVRPPPSVPRQIHPTGNTARPMPQGGTPGIRPAVYTPGAQGAIPPGGGPPDGMRGSGPNPMHPPRRGPPEGRDRMAMPHGVPSQQYQQQPPQGMRGQPPPAAPNGIYDPRQGPPPPQQWQGPPPQQQVPPPGVQRPQPQRPYANGPSRSQTSPLDGAYERQPSVRAPPARSGTTPTPRPSREKRMSAESSSELAYARSPSPDQLVSRPSQSDSRVQRGLRSMASSPHLPASGSSQGHSKDPRALPLPGSGSAGMNPSAPAPVNGKAPVGYMPNSRGMRPQHAPALQGVVVSPSPGYGPGGQMPPPSPGRVPIQAPYESRHQSRLKKVR